MAEGDPQTIPHRDPGPGRTEGTILCARGWVGERSSISLVREAENGHCRSFMGMAFRAGEWFLE